MIKCEAKCVNQSNGECILHPDKIILRVTDLDENDGYKEILKCNYYLRREGD